MKKALLTIALIATTLSTMAIPAKPGLWRTLRLADGTEVRAQLMGDEHLHYYATADGRQYVADGPDVYAPITEDQLQARAQQRVAIRQKAAQARAPRRVDIGQRTHYVGKKKGLVILVQYTDVKFRSANNLAKYKRIMNEEGYTTSEGFKGSVADYFKAQSRGQFELDFDVVGPYTLSHNRRYYGGNDYSGNDQRPEEMIVEACKAADAAVNYADYDWDGDGYVDQVFVLYAGTGEADSYDDDAVWPHMWELAETGSQLRLDGVTINTYACSNEVDMDNHIEGIGCFCHEFSHCMGFPDFYDVTYSGSFGMSDFDLMDRGSYNGGTFIPAGYSAHEMMMAGWLEPIELADEDVQVTDLKAMSEGGQSYIIYNKAHTDEYYMIENRQQTNWDAGLPAKGLMITHVDFDKDIWEANIPNSVLTQSQAAQYGLAVSNDHQRMTIFHADNDDDSKYYSSYTGSYTKTTLATDLYPYQKNDSLTNTSKPAATLYNVNTNGKKLMNRGILDIRQNSDKTVAFNFRSGTSSTTPTNPDDPNTPTELPEGTLFYESFDQCASTGGNDGKWSGSVASGAFTPDNTGWDYEFARAGDLCARFGSSNASGAVTTPQFMLGKDEAKLTFMAGAWNNSKDGTTLRLSIEGSATIDPQELTIARGAWTECEATITGSGLVRVTFTPGKRFFLDEVLVETVDHTVPTAITTVAAPERQQTVYTIDGRYLGTDTTGLKPGIYIIGGRKVVK